MESHQREERRAGPAWVIRQSKEKDHPSDAAAHLERVRHDLEAHEGSANWEASVLENVANLLDTVGRARSDWESMQAELEQARSDRVRLAEAQERAERAEHERAASEARGAELQAELESSRAECDRQRERANRLERERDEARAETEQLSAKLVSERERAAALQREHDGARAELERVRALESELDETRIRLEAALRERDVLREELQDQAATRAELAEARERLAALERESEQNLVLVCELRGRINRLEEERDEALAHGRRKVRKILDKIHAELDRAGAPRGEEFSFGERIRRLMGG